MKENWKIDCLRLAMYTAEEDGYCVGDDANRKKLLEVVDRGVRFATELGLYIIIRPSPYICAEWEFGPTAL
ncbi:MAG: beta-galactosidase, partial [Treponema sp.]|nr:beta-galactosidase [Treponema sp.]